MKKQVIILGAGISGLSTAWFLKKKGFDVLILEKENKPGGVIQTETIQGYLCENGPNTVMFNRPGIQKLIKDLALENHLLFPSNTVKKRYILLKNKLVKVPSNPLQFLTTKAISVFGKLRSAFEIFIPRLPAGKDETVKDFTTRRFGNELYEKIINPFVTGIYAGNPATLSTKYGFKMLHELEQEHGSVIKGLIHKTKKHKNQKDKVSIFSFKQGMSTLIQTLEYKLSEHILYGVDISKIKFIENQAEVHYVKEGQDYKVSGDELVSTIPAYALSDLIKPLHTQTADTLNSIPYVPIAVVHLGYKKSQIKNPAKGFGFLIPENEKSNLLGALFKTNIFPHTAPEGYELYTIITGGSRNPDITRLPKSELVELVKKEFQQIMQIDGEPEFVHTVHWHNAIPQFGLGYGELLKQFEQFSALHPNVHFSGSYISGVSVPDCIEYAISTAEAFCNKK